MAKRGPAPKRASQRRRVNKPERPVERGVGAPVVEVPAALSTWHPMAKRWFESLALSGQSTWYEPSDWRLAEVLAEQISRHLSKQVIGWTEAGIAVKAHIPMKGAELTAILRGMTQLLVSEADRRRAGIELDRPPPTTGEGDADVTWLADARRNRQSS